MFLNLGKVSVRGQIWRRFLFSSSCICDWKSCFKENKNNEYYFKSGAIKHVRCYQAPFQALEGTRMWAITSRDTLKNSSSTKTSIILYDNVLRFFLSHAIWKLYSSILTLMYQILVLLASTGWHFIDVPFACSGLLRGVCLQHVIFIHQYLLHMHVFPTLCLDIFRLY